MKKILCLLAMSLIIGQSSAFAEGWLYTDATFPGGVELQTKNSPKVGKGTCCNVLNLVEWGNCSYEAAMNNGRIKQIHHHDRNISGWIFFKKITTYVYGE